MKLVLKITKYLLVFIVGMTLLSAGLFYLNRELIKEKVVEIANSLQPGDLKVNEVHLSPFSHFPRVSLRLQDVIYFEHTEAERDSTERPICKINDFYLAFDITDLMLGKINVSEVTLDSAYVGLVQHSDSTFNFFNAVGFDPTDSTQTTTEEKVVEEDAAPTQINLKKLEVNNLVLDFENKIKDTRAALRIDHFDTKLRIKNQKLFSDINTQMTILGIKTKEKVVLREKPISFNTKLKINQENMFINILEAQLAIFQAEFSIEGTYALQQNGYADLKIKAEKEDLSLLTFLTDGMIDTKGLNNQDNGRIFLNATIKGETQNAIPFVEANFGAKDVTLSGKEKNISLENIGFNAYFTTGNKGDLTDGILKVEDVTVDSESGNIRMNALVKNFKEPYLNFSTNSSFKLESLTPFLKDDRLKNLGGTIELKGRVESNVKLTDNSFTTNEGKVGIFLKDIHFDLPHRSVKDVSGILYLYENKLGIKDFKANINNSDVHFTGQAVNILQYVAGQDTEILINTRFDSKNFYINDFLKYDSTTAHINYGHVNDFNIDLSLKTSTDKLNTYKLLPYGEFKINNFSAILPGMSDLKKLKGRLDVSPERILIDEVEGVLGESNINLTAELKNFEAITDSARKPIILSYAIDSKSMKVVDFFTHKNKLMVPVEYKDGALNGFKVNGKIITTNKQLMREGGGFPYGKVIISKLEWRFNSTPLYFRDFNIDFLHKPNEMIIENFTGKIGESDFTFNAHLENITDSTKQDLKGTFTVDAKMLNFNELLNTTFPQSTASSSTTASTENTSTEADSTAFNPFTAKYPSFDLKVDIKHMKYAKMDITNFGGQIVTTPNRLIHFKNIGTDIAGGRMNFNGDLSFVDAKNATFKSTATAKGLDMDLIHFETTYEGETFSVSENFDGILNAEINSNLYLKPDLSIDLEKSTADIEASIKDGRIVNFGPLQAMSRFFSNKDLNNIKFAEIKNSMTLKDAKLTIPKMDISSTIGQLYVSGKQGLDMNMEYLVEVPMKLVRSVAWNTLTNRKSKKEGEDEIIKDDGGKYVGIRIEGNVDDFDIKLGKGKKR